MKEDERREGGKNSYCHLPSVPRGDYKLVTGSFISKYTSVHVNLKFWAVYCRDLILPSYLSNRLKSQTNKKEVTYLNIQNVFYSQDQSFPCNYFKLSQQETEKKAISYLLTASSAYHFFQ